MNIGPTLPDTSHLSSLASSLAAIYDSDAVHEHMQRYHRIVQHFLELAGPGPVVLVRAPGRVNLIGEHTDYNQGYVMPMALDKDIVLAMRGRADRQVRLWNRDGRFAPGGFELGPAIAPSPRGDWHNYAKAAAQALCLAHGGGLSGADILVDGQEPWGVPIASGLSSSSALTVACALALAAVNGVRSIPVEFARFCSEAEWYVGTRGGIMDHFVCVLAQRDHALMLDCRPQTDPRTGAASYAMRQIPMPSGYSVLICNSAVPREKTRSQYNMRVAECRLGVAVLRTRFPQVTSLRDLSGQSLGMSERDVEQLLWEMLPERLTRRELAEQPWFSQELEAMLQDFGVAQAQEFRIGRRCRHVVMENARVLAAAAALEAGDAGLVGCLLSEAHTSMSRDYEASCPEVDALVRIALAAPGVLGARVTGAGWGGCIIALVRRGYEEMVRDQVVGRYRQATGLESTVFICRSGPGAGHVG